MIYVSQFIWVSYKAVVKVLSVAVVTSRYMGKDLRLSSFTLLVIGRIQFLMDLWTAGLGSSFTDL